MPDAPRPDVHLVHNVHAVTPAGIVRDATLRIENGRIAAIIASDAGPTGDPQPPAAGDAGPVLDGRGTFALPGFIDIHCHGARGFELSEGRFNSETGEFDFCDEPLVRGIAEYARYKAREGCTGFYPSTSAAPVETLQVCLRHLADYMAGDANGNEGTRVLGALLEGTFYNPKMAGAQDTRYAFEPAREVFDRINESGAVQLANVAPEFGEPAQQLIRYLVDRGVVCGAGHTDASGDQFRAAVDAGLRYVIHFTNGPTGGSYKSFDGGGTIEATLRSDDVWAELICDGYHVNPAYVRDIIARKGRDRIIVVTDQIFCTGTDIRRFQSGQLSGEVAPDGSHVRVVEKKNTLFGSCLTMNRGLGNLLSWLTREMPGVWNREHEALPLDDALAAAARMCATNPARMIGLDDTGSLEPDRLADITLVSLDGDAGDWRVGVERVFVRGREVEIA
jgi:N-acetylglucosamine-6-phosphate deacetylase